MKFDGDKPRLELLPWDAVEQVAWVLTYGAAKYTEGNWMKVENGLQRYLGSAMRHLSAHQQGEVMDDVTPHVANAASCCLFILHLLLKEGKIPRKYDLAGVRERFAAERAKALGMATVSEIKPGDQITIAPAETSYLIDGKPIRCGGCHCWVMLESGRKVCDCNRRHPMGSYDG